MSRGWSLRGSATQLKRIIETRLGDTSYLERGHFPTPANEAFFLSSFNFLSSVPPTDEQKLTAGRKEKAEPPDANPRHFTERRPAGRSGVK
jgi:hypothetical protein